MSRPLPTIYLILLLTSPAILLKPSLGQTSRRLLQNETQANDGSSTTQYPSHCRAGCLICSSKDMCLLCDLSLFYLPHGYDCKLAMIENCDKTNDGINCLHCKTGFYLDSQTSKCVAVTTTIENCIYYSGPAACSHCDIQYYVNPEDKTCARSSNFIEHCQWYSADSQCSACKTGKVSATKTACDTNPLFPNCIFYTSELSCYNCVSGYTLDYNKYLFDTDTNDVLAKAFFSHDLKNRNIYNWFMLTPDDVCQVSVTNCERFNYFNECAKCATGYFVGTNGGCIKNPLTKIPNCLKYSSATNCTTCEATYYLNANTCIKQDVILGCVTYSTTTKGVCDLCNDDSYFDTATSACKKRELTIKHCVVKQPNADLCQTCKESYIPSNGNTECSSAISKCTNHYFLPTADGNQRTVCQACLDGFYLRTQISGGDIITSCELPSPSILGCIVYTNNDYCSKCSTGYYLANGRCHTHTDTIIEKLRCVSYSTIRLNECSVCPAENYLYTLYNYCENLTDDELIQHCDQYDTSKNCYRCDHPYYVFTEVDPQTLKTIYSCKPKNISYCLELDRTNPKCLDCNKLVNKIPTINANDNSCVDMPDFQKKNCTDYTLDPSSLSPICQSCEAPYYPINWPDLQYGLCAKPAQIAELYYKYTAEDVVSFDNCEILDLKQTKKCRKCNQAILSDNTYKNLVSTSHTCTTGCTSEEVIETFGFDSDIAAPVSYFACKTKLLIAAFGELDNCKRIDYDVSSKGEGNFLQALYPICVECVDGYVGAINSRIQTKYVLYDYRKDFTVLQIKESAGFKEQGFWNPHNKIQGFFYCVKFDDWNTHKTKYFVGEIPSANFPASLTTESRTVVDADYNTATNSFIQQCSTLLEKDLRYGCGTCKWGYRGLRALDTGGSDLEFIISCTEISDCDTSVIYTGLGSHDNGAFLHYKVGCHKCTTATNIPTITSKLINSTTDSIQFFTTECMTAGNPDDNSSYTKAFVDNCAIQEIVEGIVQWAGYLDENPHPNPVCVACLPGYKPTSLGSYAYIRQCSLIANCVDLTENITFNQCSKCLDNFVFLYDENAKGLSLYDACVANEDPYCLVGEANGKCYKCKAQYYLNIDGHCDLLEVDGCELFGNLKNFTSSFEYLKFNPFGNGCIQCTDPEYVNVRMPYTQTSCVKSLATESYLISPKYFIKDCNRYSHDANFGVKCEECKTNFMHTNDDKYCVPNTTVDKCLIYEAQSGGASFTCVQCEDYYYLSGNECFLGKIQGCITYNNQFTCIKCQDKNIPTRIRNGQYTICFDRSQSLQNCETIDANEGFKGVISCTKCSNTSYPFLFDLSIKTCAQFYRIDNCLIYDTQETFSDSSFFCNQCALEYYADQAVFPNLCVSRQYFPIPNCLTYNLTSDKCDICIESFYLAGTSFIHLTKANGLNCEPNPIGMVGCVEFKSIDKCKVCDDQHYQFNNECKTVNTLINNCEIYESETVCQLCKQGYNLLGEKCSITEIENCTTVGYNGTCETCISGFKPFGDKCEAVSLANCSVFLNKNECSICESNYYLSSGRCFEVDVIANCSQNKSKDTCEYCNTGYALSSDEKSCIEMTTDQKALYGNAKCANYRQDNRCGQCDEGYYFSTDNSQCVKCETDDTCAYCDFKDPTRCIMCKSSNFMTIKPNNVCVKNSVLNVAEVVEEVVLPDIYIVGSQKIIGLFLVFSWIGLLGLSV